MNKTKLDNLRQEIDSIDDRILQLLNARAEVALRVKEAKGTTAIYNPAREAAIVRRMQASNTGHLPNQAIAGIYREIISSCRNLEQPLSVAYLGPAGSYSHEAALKSFGETANFIPQLSLPEVIKSVNNAAADLALLPIENSTEGAVTESHRLLLATDLLICKEFILPIRHCLLTSERKIEEIKVVHAHPQALGQCREWLQLHLPHARLVSEASTSQAAANVKDSPGQAAIGSIYTAETTGVPILVTGINDFADNQTRFIALGKFPAVASAHDKTSIICSVRDKVGALHELLAILAKHEVNLVRLESQPHSDHEYVFYIDIEGHQNTPTIKTALHELAQAAKTCKILGSYPKDVSQDD